VTWTGFGSTGVLDLDFDLPGGDSLGSGEGVESGCGAHDGLRPALVLMLSISTLKNGSGSSGSMMGESSERLGLCGLAGFTGVNVT
jgi:hypothetical protein